MPKLPSRIVSIVPRFRPDIDGIGECSLVIANRLYAEHGTATDFLVFNPARDSSGMELSDSPHTVTRAAAPTGEAMQSALGQILRQYSEPPTLLLHYASYGYSPLGTPTWLPALVRRFTACGGQLVGFYHELYAVGKFPSRVFFNSWLQQRIFRQLLTESRCAIVSSDQSVERIAAIQSRYKQTASVPTRLVGICSNIGELSDLLPLAERSPRLVIFGQYLSRKRLYERHLTQLKAICDRHGITEIADLGPTPDSWLRELGERTFGNRFRLYGALPTDEASHLLATSRIGAVDYDYPRRWKSGIFGAYQAHGQAIVLFPYTTPPEPHDAGDWCFTPERMLAADAATLQTEATRGFAHYQQHRSSGSIVAAMLPYLDQEPA